ncbi:ImmA/IrrE family metallo-endopeptidase [Leptolyngbya sp. FACHB-541]|uniref:ImmA/IrrE family metallo-endopeptidase n=1 Tax=Leptolyngbya sp. FACHB-541 TaxID=2692810 RepID=UPI001689B96A|nr:ImmA/IrrE family metallo-endopeptidase [Leptolyngbya sp. FACHB-541]MBD2001411.1 ImmA/IrrE family metallo-endopeptidase [Leptolyngbya sp. FACHB-541]
MSLSTLSEERKAEIALSVRRIYEEAGFDPTSLPSGIVPLSNIVNSLDHLSNILVLEVPVLSYRTAAQFLSEHMNKHITLDGDPEKNLAGFLYAYESDDGSLDGCILVAQSDPISRRRFSIGHELGHYFLHFLPKLQEKQNTSSKTGVIAEGLVYGEVGDGVEGRPLGQLTFLDVVEVHESEPAWNPAQMEEEANFFAAELLMPTEICETLATRYHRRFGSKREVLAGRIAPELLVSPPAVKRRLQELQLPKKIVI